MTAHHLTVRGVPPRLAKALEREKRRRRQSLNATVIQLLSQALGLDPARDPTTNGLEVLAGGWSDEQLEAFEANTAFLEQIDKELWR
jgi:kynureninase